MIAVIMPVYNTEEYLRAAIDSVICQTLPFEENIRLYLIDDASTDGSLKICQEYQKKYPDNIVVKHFEENQGVSAIRNYGIRQCRKCGDVIVSFLDSDDKFGEDVFERVVEFFDEHPDINMATVEIMLFGAMTKDHKINWRFRDKEVVNIQKDYTNPHYYIGGAFVRRTALQKLEFDETMQFWEDALAINQVILDEGQYGLVSGVYYYYRKRSDESSLVDVAWKSKERYTSFLESGYGKIMACSKRSKHRIIPYVQFLVAYHMRLFMVRKRQQDISDTLTEEEIVELRRKLQKILKKIKVNIILQVPTSLPIIEEMLSIRAGRQIRAKRVYRDKECRFVYKGVELARISERRVQLYKPIDKPDSEFDGMWKATFYTPVYAMKKQDKLFVKYHGERIEAREYRGRKQLFILGKRLRCFYHARFAIDLPADWDTLTFGIYLAEGDTEVLLNRIERQEWEMRQKGLSSGEEMEMADEEAADKML